MASFNVITLGFLLYVVLDMSIFTYQHIQIEHFNVGRFVRLYRQMKKLCVCVVVYSSYFVRLCIRRFILIHLNCMISPSMTSEVRSLLVYFCIFKLNVRTEASKFATVMCAHIPLNFLLAHLPQVHVFSHCALAYLACYDCTTVL